MMSEHTPRTLRYAYEPDQGLCIAALNDHAGAWEDEVAALKRENEMLREGCGMDGCKMKSVVSILDGSVIDEMDALLTAEVQ